MEIRDAREAQNIASGLRMAHVALGSIVVLHAVLPRALRAYTFLP